MVKSVLAVKHQGARDWAIQRVSAIVMAIYSISLIAYLVFHPGISYLEWRAIFAQTGAKVATLIFLFALLYHAWIGMWTIFTDYVKPFVLRAIIEVLVILLLMACFLWGVMILWSV